jgi:hypothetical protein
MKSPNYYPVLALMFVAAAFGFIIGMYYMEANTGMPSVHDYILLASKQQHQVLLSPQQQAEKLTMLQQLDLPAVWPFAPEQPRWAFKGVQKASMTDGEADLIPLCNATFVERHPLTDSDYERSYTPGGPCSMPPGLLQKIQSGAAVKIIVVGGSMTRGRACFDGNRTLETCAWSSRLQARLNEVFQDSNITVVNKALPGFSYSNWTGSGMFGGLVDADVLIVDEQVNSHVSSCHMDTKVADT